MGTFTIIGLCGAAGCGKSTAAAYLAERYELRRLRFADPLKNMLRAYYGTLGVLFEEVERRIEGDLKALPDPILGGKTPRYAMQTLGTEWGRDGMANWLWMRAWQKRVEAARKLSLPGVVVEDVRFPNEAVALREEGGKLVRIVRPGQAEVAGGIAGHSSEGQPLSPDQTIYNHGGFGDLHVNLRGAMAGYGVPLVWEDEK